ncbi:MAG TPA: DUF1638 domain-containing protein [Verrucomicrobiota bacterium]|nr:DUF1638 domain-containing protein [Verrucomicrobiota bacterium]
MKAFKVLACEVAVREIGQVVSRCPHAVDLEFLPVGNHDDPRRGREDLQARVDAIPAGRYDAILIGYGLCNRILAGLRAGHTPLVIPRAHDCLTLFLGSRTRYEEVFREHTGAYFFTAGWLEFPWRRARARGESAPAGENELASMPMALDQTFEELVAKYGEDNAKYLVEVSAGWARTYQAGFLIRFPFDGMLDLPARVQAICQRRGWRYEETQGDLGLLERWMDGPWAEDEFLVVQPGAAVEPAYDGRIICERAGSV